MKHSKTFRHEDFEAVAYILYGETDDDGQDVTRLAEWYDRQKDTVFLHPDTRELVDELVGRMCEWIDAGDLG